MSKSTILYRYFPETAAINTIERRHFRVGRILEFNDPFEWSMCVDEHSTSDIATAQGELDRMRAYFNERWGVISFCKRVNDPVIWSHYADKHTGIAVKVACDASEIGKNILPVIYRKKRLCIPFIPVEEREQRIEELRPGFTDFFRYKAPSWSYEKEVRGIVELQNCNVTDGNFWWPIPNGFVKSVIIGLRSMVSVSYIRRALDLNGFENVEIQRVRESSKNYNLVPVSIRGS